MPTKHYKRVVEWIEWALEHKRSLTDDEMREYLRGFVSGVFVTSANTRTPMTFAERDELRDYIELAVEWRSRQAA